MSSSRRHNKCISEPGGKHKEHHKYPQGQGARVLHRAQPHGALRTLPLPARVPPRAAAAGQGGEGAGRRKRRRAGPRPGADAGGGGQGAARVAQDIPVLQHLQERGADEAQGRRLLPAGPAGGNPKAQVQRPRQVPQPCHLAHGGRPHERTGARARGVRGRLNRLVRVSVLFGKP